MSNKITSLLVLLTIFTFSTSVNAQETEEIKPKFKIGGFIKTDFITTQYNNGNAEKGNFLNDFHLASKLPVGNIDRNINTNFHVKESRLNLTVNHKIGDNTLKAFAEIDFMLSPSGNSIISNSFAPRLRHFFVNYNNFTFGQTWSTFMIVTLPDDLDFTGAGEGIVFVRQPLIKYSTNGWQFALENPTSTYMYSNAEINDKQHYTKQTKVNDLVPDAIIRKDFKGDWGNFSVSTIFRNVHVDNNDSDYFGYGTTLGGKFNVGEKDDIRFTVAGGHGIGRYVALGLVTAGELNADNEFKTLPVANGYVSYLHHWNNKFRSSINASALYAETSILKNTEGTKSAYSGSANLIYSPVAGFLVGAEYMYAYRELTNKTEGSFNRLQFSAKYSF
ncbi:MAG: hypothetical protein KAG96_01005 [Ichthyobacteriaceae bacterium]|nr:hypothetical protein [Ichthyobacteriaceae bacterium]